MTPIAKEVINPQHKPYDASIGSRLAPKRGSHFGVKFRQDYDQNIQRRMKDGLAC